MKKLKIVLLILVLSFLSKATFCLFANDLKLISNTLSTGIKVDLRMPKFENGILSTEQGGIIEGSDIRIQARKIRYIKKKEGSETNTLIEAEGDLIVEFKDYLFVGEKLQYDFSKRSGVLYQARTALPPWFFGGEKIYLNNDGSYRIENGFVTTSENEKPEWAIETKEAEVTKEKLVKAKGVKFVYDRVPLLKLPIFRLNLGSIFDQPIRYEARGGSQGPRISIAYKIFSWENFKTFVRVDYRLKRGWGAGAENYYKSKERNEKFESVSFIARDAKSTGDHPVTIRYRFQGAYRREFEEKKMTIDAKYDKLSDKEMATDYEERGLSYIPASRTEFIARKENDLSITNFLTRVRVNGFQTLKQELPTLQSNFMPLNLEDTGIIVQNQIKASYLDFKYAHGIKNKGYKSTKLQFTNKIYRPIPFQYFKLTPEIGALAIIEGNSPKGVPSYLALATFAFELKTRLYKFYHNQKQVVEPYLRYEYTTFPTRSPKQHYIFDIEDGVYTLNMVRFGVNQNFYDKSRTGQIARYLNANLWANAFINSHTIPAFIPKIYSRATLYPLSSVTYVAESGWDFEEQQLDHLNLRTEWTVNDDFAISTEYRHRGAYAFRKADPYNFFVDNYHKLKRIRDSQMSDRRDTLLLHFFYRLHPNWSIELESRHGWNRHRQPCYNEFEVDLRGILWSAWNVKLSYQHLEDDDRIVFAFSLGLKPPDRRREGNFAPKLEF